MAELLKGAAVAASINEKTIEIVEMLKSKGITPRLAIVRVGESDDDLAYETGIYKRCGKLGIDVKTYAFCSCMDWEYAELIEKLNKDSEIHGILMLRPLPDYLDNEAPRKILAPEKDVDGCTDGSLAGVFTNTDLGFAPCTAQAAMEILDYYGIDPKGKRAVVIGRSLVVGRPAAMMLMHKNATVTICHTRTENVPSICKDADIIIAASGQMESLKKDCFRQNQTVIDVGIGWNKDKQKLCGDVLFEDASQIVENITPVPGGVGAVTTSVLALHVAQAAKRQNKL